MKIYEELEQKRLTLFVDYERIRKKRNLLFTIGIICLVIGIAPFLPGNGGSPIFVLITLVGMFFMILSGANSVKATKITKSFENIVKNEFVEKMLGEIFETSDYYPNAHIDLNKINSAELYKRPDRFNGEDLITGEVGGVRFQVSDITLTERREVHTKNGTTVTYVDYFKGRWYIYKFPKNFNETLKIMESRSGAVRGLKKYETEMIEFNKKFSIFSSSEQFFFYLINPYLIEKLLLLEQSHRGTINYAFIDDELHIAINDNSDSLKVNFKVPITKESLRLFEEDLTLIKTIVAELRLYDVKFQKDK